MRKRYPELTAVAEAEAEGIDSVSAESEIAAEQGFSGSDGDDLQSMDDTAGSLQSLENDDEYFTSDDLHSTDDFEVQSDDGLSVQGGESYASAMIGSGHDGNDDSDDNTVKSDDLQSVEDFTVEEQRQEE